MSKDVKLPLVIINTDNKHESLTMGYIDGGKFSLSNKYCNWADTLDMARRAQVTLNKLIKQIENEVCAACGQTHIRKGDNK